VINLKGRKVILTGATSMIGRSVVRSLRRREAIIQPLFHEDIDLMNFEQTRDLFIDMKPDYCIHLAGYNGNIRFNSLYPADIFHKTSMMGMNVLTACKEARIKKTVSVLSSCGYKASEEPLSEAEFLNGEPDESTEAHAYGKRDLLIYSKLLNKQHDFKAACCIFNTVYGPFDNFDLNKTKVVGSLIKKFVDAVENDDKTVECWGSRKCSQRAYL
jgi:GDP-L-fucose synthase